MLSTAAYLRALEADELTKLGEAVDIAMILSIAIPGVQIVPMVATVLGGAIDTRAALVQRDVTILNPSFVGITIESPVGGKVGITSGAAVSILTNHCPRELRMK